MEDSKRMVELLAEMLIEQRGMREELRGVKAEQQKTNERLEHIDHRLENVELAQKVQTLVLEEVQRELERMSEKLDLETVLLNRDDIEVRFEGEPWRKMRFRRKPELE